MPLVLNTATNPGTAVFSSLTGILATAGAAGPLLVTLAPAPNVFPQPASSGTTVTALEGGTYMILIFIAVNFTGALAGTALQQSTALGYAKDGVSQVALGTGGWIVSPRLTDEYQHVHGVFIATLVAGEAISLEAGFNAEQANASLNISNQHLLLIPL